MRTDMNTTQDYGEPCQPFGAVGINTQRGQLIAKVVNGVMRDRFISTFNACAGISDPEKAIQAAREALKLAASISTNQDCPSENHAVVLAAMDALNLFTLQQP